MRMQRSALLVIDAARLLRSTPEIWKSIANSKAYFPSVWERSKCIKCMIFNPSSDEG